MLMLPSKVMPDLDWQHLWWIHQLYIENLSSQVENWKVWTKTWCKSKMHPIFCIWQSMYKKTELSDSFFNKIKSQYFFWKSPQMCLMASMISKKYYLITIVYLPIRPVCTKSRIYLEANDLTAFCCCNKPVYLQTFFIGLPDT